MTSHLPLFDWLHRFGDLEILKKSGRSQFTNHSTHVRPIRTNTSKAIKESCSKIVNEYLHSYNYYSREDKRVGQ